MRTINWSRYKWLLISLGTTLVFCITMTWYLYSPATAGPWPLTVISGAVAAVHCLSLIFSGIGLWKYKFHWQALVTILLNILVIILNGYAFVLGLIISMSW